MIETPDLPVRSVEELVTFASIVEKETGRPDERDRVAAVFYNRLKKGMRLQSDPTIIYGIVGGQGILGRSITKADIDAKSPYNTYQINGLPPGPICNPGKSAILAALHPAKTADLYFVADGSGGHTFSETLKEHNSAVQKWRAVEKQSKAKQGAGDTLRSGRGHGANTARIPSPVPSRRRRKNLPRRRHCLHRRERATVIDVRAGDCRTRFRQQAQDMPLPVRKPKKQ